MKRYFSKQLLTFTVISLCCMGFSIQRAYGDAPPTVKSPETFSGYTKGLIISTNATPYGVITGEDVIPSVVGYGLLTKPALADNAQYNGPFQPGADTASSDMPNINATTATQFLLGTLLQSTPTQDEIKGYSDTLSGVFKSMDSAALPPISSASSYNSVANVGNANSLTATINQAYANPYDSSSLFNYVPAAAHSSANPAQIYISLVDGSLTPVPLPTTATDDFSMQLRRIAAIQTAGVNALQSIFDRSKPVLNDNDASSMQSTLKALGDNSLSTAPTSKRDFEKIMATHRLDPNNQWFVHVQQASPEELQRQQLYVQAEMLYELHEIRKEEEQNKMLLAIALLAQGYQSRTVLNLQSQMSPSAIKAATAAATK